MVVGEHARESDLDVNIVREKKLTNMRASGSDRNLLLKPPRLLLAAGPPGLWRRC